MLAKLFALAFVALLVFVPARFLLRLAWFEGGAVRAFAILCLFLAFVLTSWLVAPTVPGQTQEEHIADFIGAAGILIGSSGILAIAATLIGKFRVPKRPNHQ